MRAGFDGERGGFDIVIIRPIAYFCKKNIMQTSFYQIDSLGQELPIQMDTSVLSISSLFIEGGAWFMTVLSLLLIAVLFAAWKAPAWIREIGTGAALVGGLFSLFALYQMLDIISLSGDISPTILCGGLKCAILPLCYGLIIDFLSLIIRLIQKPRI